MLGFFGLARLRLPLLDALKSPFCEGQAMVEQFELLTPDDCHKLALGAGYSETMDPCIFERAPDSDAKDTLRFYPGLGVAAVKTSRDLVLVLALAPARDAFKEIHWEVEFCEPLPDEKGLIDALMSWDTGELFAAIEAKGLSRQLGGPCGPRRSGWDGSL